MAECDNAEEAIERIEVRFSELAQPIVDYLRKDEISKVDTHLFLLTLMSNVYHWLRISCSENEVDYTCVMARIVLNMNETLKEISEYKSKSKMEIN